MTTHRTAVSAPPPLPLPPDPVPNGKSIIHQHYVGLPWRNNPGQTCTPANFHGHAGRAAPPGFFQTVAFVHAPLRLCKGLVLVPPRDLQLVLAGPNNEYLQYVETQCNCQVSLEVNPAQVDVCFKVVSEWNTGSAVSLLKSLIRDQTPDLESIIAVCERKVSLLHATECFFCRRVVRAKKIRSVIPICKQLNAKKNAKGRRPLPPAHHPAAAAATLLPSVPLLYLLPREMLRYNKTSSKVTVRSPVKARVKVKAKAMPRILTRAGQIIQVCRVLNRNLCLYRMHQKVSATQLLTRWRSLKTRRC